jgi:hypothetical protein
MTTVLTQQWRQSQRTLQLYKNLWDSNLFPHIYGLFQPMFCRINWELCCSSISMRKKRICFGCDFSNLINMWMRALFWTEEDEVNCGQCRSVETNCRTTFFGGLGVKDLKLKGLALRVSWEWEQTLRGHGRAYRRPMMLGRVCNLYGLSLFLIYIHAILLLEKKEILRPRIGSSELRRLMTSTL